MNKYSHPTEVFNSSQDLTKKMLASLHGVGCSQEAGVISSTLRRYTSSSYRISPQITCLFSVASKEKSLASPVIVRTKMQTELQARESAKQLVPRRKEKEVFWVQQVLAIEFHCEQSSVSIRIQSSEQKKFREFAITKVRFVIPESVGASQNHFDCE